jgi:hypothetical protein
MNEPILPFGVDNSGIVSFVPTRASSFGDFLVLPPALSSRYLTIVHCIGAYVHVTTLWARVPTSFCLHRHFLWEKTKRQGHSFYPPHRIAF